MTPRRFHVCSLLLALTTGLFAVGLTSPARADEAKTPVPSATDIDRVKGLLKDIFKEEYANKTPAGRAVLCKKLLDQVKQVGNDRNAQYVMLKEAFEQSLLLGDTEVAFAAISQLNTFQVDREQLEADALAVLAKNAKTPAANATVANRAIDLADKFAEREDFDNAGKLGAIATAAAAKSADTALVKAIQQHNNSLRTAKEEAARIKAARDLLVRDPENRDANLLVGKHLCLNKDDWAGGLALIGKAGDAALKDAADRDAAALREQVKPVEAANAWFALSEKIPVALKSLCQRRARYWYQQVLPSLAGLEKTVVEKRLSALDAELAAAGGPALKPIELTLSGNVKMIFRPIPAGKFAMGSPANEPLRKENETQHTVTISKSFYLGQTEVTQAQWKAVTGSNPALHQGDLQLPVENVNWDSANTFCQTLTKAFASKQYKFRLPTEAEWEYACRAGTTTMFSFGNDLAKLPEYGWIYKNSKNETHPVGQLKPNAWGLYDMHGNVGEWCQDYLTNYESASVIDPIQNKPSDRRVNRGGSALTPEAFLFSLRSAGRGGNPATEIRGYVGLRLVLEAN